MDPVTQLLDVDSVVVTACPVVAVDALVVVLASALEVLEESPPDTPAVVSVGLFVEKTLETEVAWVVIAALVDCGDAFDDVTDCNVDPSVVLIFVDDLGDVPDSIVDRIGDWIIVDDCGGVEKGELTAEVTDVSADDLDALVLLPATVVMTSAFPVVRAAWFSAVVIEEVGLPDMSLVGSVRGHLYSPVRGPDPKQ